MAERSRSVRSRKSPQPKAEPVAETPIAAPPEVAFAARVEPKAPPPPLPTHRRAIFIDVENTSRVSDIAKVLGHLAVERRDMNTELVASGNWRVIGSETARLLAKAGAHLVHSAPATGVRDWSDLRIAVAAGVWLAAARSGDVLEIVSDDRAFDVVGDVAASLGVQFQRISPKTLAPAQERPRRKRAAEVAEVPAPAAEPAQEAPPDNVLSVVRELLAQSSGSVSLDAVANRLKTLGYQRPPNSPRLVTRLRGMPELDVSPRGHIRLRAADSTATEPSPASPPRRRRGRRGGARNGTGTPPAPVE